MKILLNTVAGRIKERERVIYPTDKSGKLAVTMFENYHKQGQVHIRKDKEVNWGGINETQNSLKSLIRALDLIFNTGIGQSNSSKARAWKAREAMATIIPNLYIFPKDHKEVGADGQPKTRPVCGASETMNQELSEWVSELVEAALKGMDSKEMISTEELLGHKQWRGY